MEISKLFSESLSQAYIFSKKDVSLVMAEIENIFSIKFGSGSNAVFYEIENFGIDDSREINKISSLSAEGETFIVISARSITVEAQNALLKTIEEPKLGIHFLLFTQDPKLLLPTLRSRSVIIENISDDRNFAEKTDAKNSHPNFLKITLSERFDYIEKLSKKFKKDDPNAFRDSALEIFDAVIFELSKEIYNKNSDQLEKILELRSYLNDRGSSAKQLLETMAMQLHD